MTNARRIRGCRSAPPRRFAHFQAGTFGEWVTGDYGYVWSNCHARRLGTVTARIPAHSDGIKVWVDGDANT